MVTLPGGDRSRSGREARLGGPRSRLAVALVTGAVAVLVYLPSLWNDFVWDDSYNIVANESIRDLRNIPSFFTSHWAAGAEDDFARDKNVAVYRPLAQVSYTIDYALFGLAPWGFQLVNVLLHALVTMLVVWLALQLFKTLPPRDMSPSLPVLVALVAGLWFALHPVHSEAVNVISYRTSLLDALFYLLALNIRLASATAGDRRRALADWLLLPLVYVLALSSKESAFTLPFAVVLLDRTVLRAEPFARQARVYPVLFGLALGFLLWRRVLLEPSPFVFFPDETFATVFWTMLKVPALYLGLLIVPLNLNPFRDWSVFPPVDTPADSEVLAGIMVVVLWALGVILAWRRSPAVAFGLGLAGVALLPYTQLSPFITVGGERFLYVSAAGLSPLVGYGFVRLCLRLRRRWVIPALLLVIYLGGLAGLTVQRTREWRTTESILLTTVQRYPHGFNAWFALGQLLMAEERHAEAAESFRGALRLLPDLRAVRLWLAKAELKALRPSRALETLEGGGLGEDDPEARALIEKARRLLE